MPIRELRMSIHELNFVEPHGKSTMMLSPTRLYLSQPRLPRRLSQLRRRKDCVLLVETVTDIAWLHRAEHTAAIPIPRIRRLQQLQRPLIEVWVLLRQRYWIEEVRGPAGNEHLRVRV